MHDVALTYQKILNSVSRFGNGDSSLLMNSLGLDYKLNYGVSVPEIDKLALCFEKSNELAVFLLNQSEREAKLLAFRLFEYNSSPEDFINDVINSITNTEIAEQAAMHYFVKLSGFFKIAQKLINHTNEYCRLSAYLAIARYVRINKSASDKVLWQILAQYKQSVYADESLPFIRAQLAMLSAILLRNEELRNKVHECIDNKSFTNNELKFFYKQELERFNN